MHAKMGFGRVMDVVWLLVTSSHYMAHISTSHGEGTPHILMIPGVATLPGKDTVLLLCSVLIVYCLCIIGQYK